MHFSVQLLVYNPIEGRTIVWVPVHHHFGLIAITIEDILSRIACYIEEPVKVVQGKVGGIDVDASVLDQKRKTIHVSP